MPELPDLVILADAFQAALIGRRLSGASVRQSLVLRGTPGELHALNDQRLEHVERRGKFLTFEFERDRIRANPMLTGRFGLAPPASRPFPQTAAVLLFAGREERVAASSGWPGDAPWLPAADAPVELRYRDSTRMGKLYLLPDGVARQVAGWDEQGPDADDPALTLDVWRTRIRRYSGELKNLLRNQEFVAGIGNAYSDEILWAARLAPYRSRASLADDEVDELYRATRDVLAWAVEQLRQRVPPRLEVEQRAFLRVHAKGGEDCPRCGARLSEVTAGGFVTTFCRSCQR